MRTMKERGATKEQWTNEREYVLSMLGNCVGLTNLWRFPYICQKNGGGAFLIPFIVCLVGCGLPTFFLETAVGQYSAKNNVHVWSVCPLLKGVGIGQYIVSTVCILYWQHILGWTIYYMWMSCSKVLPWTTCNNTWNTPECADRNGTDFMNLTTEGNLTVEKLTLSNSPAQEFWEHNTLGISRGPEYIGRIQGHLVICQFLAWVVVFLCLLKGVRSVGKVVYVTALLPYILLGVLLIRTAMLPGAVDGILTYLKPDFEKLITLQVWMDALLQVFFSLGAGWGTVLTLASYNKFNYNCLRNSVGLTFSAEGTSLYCGLVIFTLLGFMASQAGVDVSKLSSSGPGLAFILYAEGVAQLPFPQIWSVLFFLMVFSVGLDSLFVWAETLLTPLIDQFPRTLGRRRILLTAVLFMAYFLLGLIFATEGGMYYFQLVDWYCAFLAVSLFVVLECFTFMWIYGSERFNQDINMMIGRRVPRVLNFLLRFVSPIMAVIISIMLVFKYEPPTYGSHKYTFGSQVGGWIIAAIPVIPVPVMAAIALFKAEGSLLEKLKASCRPEETWKPAIEAPMQLGQYKYKVSNTSEDSDTSSALKS